MPCHYDMDGITESATSFTVTFKRTDKTGGRGIKMTFPRKGVFQDRNTEITLDEVKRLAGNLMLPLIPDFKEQIPTKRRRGF